MRFNTLWAILFLALPLSNSATAFEDKENTYAALLTSGNNAHIILATESLFYEKSTNTELLDIVAELMWRGSKEELYISSDGLSWLAKTLGQSQLSRYQQVLKKADANMAILEKRDKPAETWGGDEEEEESEVKRRGDGPVRPSSDWSGSVYTSVIDDIHTEVNHTKVREYIADALERLTISSSEDFVEGSIDHKALVERIEKYKKANHKARQDIVISSIKRGTYISDVYQQLGLPDSESVYFVRKMRAFIGRVSLARLQVKYGDQGVIQFLLQDEAQPGWYVYKVYSFQPEGLIAKLSSQDTVQIKKAAKYIYKAFIFDTATLDAAAKRVWDSMNTDDHYLADSVAWLCKGIGKSGNSRYLTIMQDVANNAQNERIRNYAKKQIKLLHGGNAPQYISYKH